MGEGLRTLDHRAATERVHNCGEFYWAALVYGIERADLLPFFCPSPPPCSEPAVSQLCTLARVSICLSSVHGGNSLLLKPMTKDPKHYFAACILHLRMLGDHKVSVQIVLHSFGGLVAIYGLQDYCPHPTLLAMLVCVPWLPSSPEHFHPSPVTIASGSFLTLALTSWPNKNLAALGGRCLPYL